jgi:prepilin-type N-terminal cleavage/methylation domain-containing protein/prepilin-type processing-associated H-X9-DG protein
MCDRNQRHWRKPAFTLVELLVVLAILTVLLALLMPTISRARRQARSVICLSNLRQLGVAFQVYVNNNKGKSFIGYGSVDNYWLRVLEPEMVGGKGVLYCPEAPDNIGHTVVAGGSPRMGTAFHAWANSAPGNPVDAVVFESSYGMNGWINHLKPAGPPPYGDEAMRDFYIPLPAKDSDAIPLFADCTGTAGWPLHTDTPPRNLLVPIPTTGTSQDKVCAMHGFCMARHGRAINVVFLDGHARRVPLEELWRLKWHRHFEPTTVTLPPE